MLSTSFTKHLAMLLCCVALVGCQDSDVRLGREALKAGDSDKALSLFSIAADRNPTDGSVRALIALAHARKGDMVQAIQWVNLAHRLGSGSEVSVLFADDARSLLATQTPLALAMYRIAVEQDASLSKSIAGYIAGTAARVISNSPLQGINLYDAALKYDPSLASNAAKQVSAVASKLIDSKEYTALQLYQSAVQYDQAVSSVAAEIISKKGVSQIEVEPDDAINLINIAIEYNPALKSKLALIAAEKAIQSLETNDRHGATLLINFAVKYEPTAATTFAKAALARAISINSDPAQRSAAVTIELTRMVQALNVTDANDAWADLLFKEVESSGDSVSSVVEAGSLVLQFDRSRDIALANLCDRFGKEAVSRDDLETADKFYNSAVKFHAAIKSTISDEVWDQFSHFLFSTQQIRRSSFIKFFKMIGEFGVSSKYATTILPYVNALSLYSGGYRARAIPALEQIARSRPKSPEGQAAASILAAPTPGTIKVNSQSFHFGTWLYGPGQGKGVDIQMISSEVTKDEIKVKFNVRSAGHPDLFLFGHENRNGGIGGGSCELPYILDSNGVKFYSTSGGFVGGKQSNLNECAVRINFDPDEEAVISASFPMISRGATGFQFFSPDPDKAGHQGGWQWNDIQIKKPAFDQLDLVREPLVSTASVTPLRSGEIQSSRPPQPPSRCFTFNGQQVCN